MPVTLNGSTGIAGVDGSAATPALQGSDTNSGVFYGADFVAVTTNGVEKTRVDSSGNFYVETGNLWQYAPAPTAKAAVATLTAAELIATIISTTGTSYTLTLPTGTALDAGFTGVPTNNIGFDFHVVNTASGTITIAVNTGVTSLGALTITTGTSGHFRLRRTAANTYILYRLA